MAFFIDAFAFAAYEVRGGGFGLGGRGGDEGLARTRGGYLRKTWRNRGKNEVRLGAWHLGLLTRLEMDPVAHGREVARVVVGHLKSGAFPPSLVLGSVWKNGATF